MVPCLELLFLLRKIYAIRKHIYSALSLDSMTQPTVKIVTLIFFVLFGGIIKLAVTIFS